MEESSHLPPSRDVTSLKNPPRHALPMAEDPSTEPNPPPSACLLGTAHVHTPDSPFFFLSSWQLSQKTGAAVQRRETES